MKTVRRVCSAIRLAALVTSAVTAVTADAAVQYHPREDKPFSSAVRVGDFVFVSGAGGAAADGNLPADFATQATNAMNLVAKELQLAGASMEDVYRCTIALTNMDNWAAFNTVYLKYFKPNHYPVRMSIGVTSLGGAAVEVQCEAYLGK